MPRIYVISPFKGKDGTDKLRNIEMARQICKRIVAIGHSPFASHLLYPQFLDDDVMEDRTLGMACGNDFLRVCKEAWVYGEPSEGMIEDIKVAETAGIRIRYKELPR